MTKHIFLHIGHYKTGSSALQSFLSQNASTMREYGFLYPSGLRPRNNPTNHGQLSLSLAREYGFAGPAWYGEAISADDAYRELHAELSEAPEDKVILSSEEFVQLAMRDDPDLAIANLKAHLATYQVTILFYIREPFSLLKSWFNELNKGPVATRTFPVYFMKLNDDFLAQQPIWSAFARHFGQENIKLLTYKHVGRDHIAEFLRVAGCDMPLPEEPPKLVQQAQPEEILEFSRLAKDRRGSLDDYTISRIGNISKFINKVQRINEQFSQIANLSDEIRPSQLSAAAIIDYYARLLRPLRPTGNVNQKEANNLRKLALKAEDVDLGLARALMQAAQVIRPNGDFINKKLAEYNS
ncbi:hypothetical protein [Paracoccus saliphilus]|uniref:Sulfotransferase family protein n=1 Tax=Paracoccus saliphilus TaxID=405559 RepID=A0AA46A6G4_9RHOB|nr:hypothetical protein [Paracoccus saliphilus]WCR05485.1 hypothetical protein JHX88_21715 [Paracoccus saliphilus]SIS97295.1 hypothetical protein SAMN05421772_110160 [Paracoccus saliphilus]